MTPTLQRLLERAKFDILFHVDSYTGESELDAAEAENARLQPVIEALTLALTKAIEQRDGMAECHTQAMDRGYAFDSTGLREYMNAEIDAIFQGALK